MALRAHRAPSHKKIRFFLGKHVLRHRQLTFFSILYRVQVYNFQGLSSIFAVSKSTYLEFLQLPLLGFFLLILKNNFCRPAFSYLKVSLFYLKERLELIEKYVFENHIFQLLENSQFGVNCILQNTQISGLWSFCTLRYLPSRTKLALNLKSIQVKDSNQQCGGKCSPFKCLSNLLAI